MNIMFVTSAGELVTPESPSILDGVTRDSILRLASDHGLTAVERPIDVDELQQRLADGSFAEAFACGTAAVVTPIVGFKAPTWEHAVGAGEVGEKTSEIRRTLLDIQYGRTVDTFGWTEQV